MRACLLSLPVLAPALSTLLVLATLTGAGGAGAAGEGAGPALAPPHQQQLHVAAAAGQDGVLRCVALRLADKAVSWVRARDLQILTHAGAVFTSDARVSAAAHGTAAGAGSVHELRIARLRPADAGRYECQLNTEPKTSLLFNLTVLERAAPARVLVRPEGPQRVRAAPGAVATLACAAQYELPPGSPPGSPPGPPSPSLQIRWRRAGGDPLDATSARGGVSLEAERWAGGARSALALAAVRARDAGRYWCEAGGARAELLLLVADGPDTPAGVAGADGLLNATSLAPAAEGGAAEAMLGDAAVPSAAPRAPPACAQALAVALALALSPATRRAGP